jgi:hypothetical protein
MPARCQFPSSARVEARPARARAEILILDLDDPGDELIQRDTDTGLDWLSLAATASYSLGAYEDGGSPLFYGRAGWASTVQSPYLAFQNELDFVDVTAAEPSAIHAHWLVRPSSAKIAAPVLGGGGQLLLTATFAIVGGLWLARRRASRCEGSRNRCR